MTIRMGYWDCPSCNHKRNLGPNPTCQGCGLARGPKIPFYTDDSAPVVEDPELVARARAGADWKCKYCGADNRAGVMDCHQCGAGPDGSVKREEKFAPVAAAAAPPKKGLSLGVLLGILGGVLAVIGLTVWFLFFRTSKLEVTVESVSWVKTVEVLELKATQRENWRDQVPTSNAKIIKTEKRGREKEVQEGTKKVKTGTKDLGNGMFEDVYKEEPNIVKKKVDDEWVTYEVEEWQRVEVLESTSKDGKEPPDPEIKGGLNDRRKIGERTNKAVYQLKGSNGKPYSYEVDASKDGSAIKKFEIGKKYTAKITTLGVVRELGP